ncbi:MAG: hypothetical protein QUU85_08720 [Candidatus Eisenbacteria bacterium]|nr:hypothetical protein [Candidatus Eisenbacteria bacterium]
MLARAGIDERPAQPFTEAESAYLRRVLPFWSLTYTIFQDAEMSGNLANALCLAGMTGCYGYREALRTMLDRQSPDGSFPQPGGGEAQARPEAIYGPTSTCLSALCRERERLAGTSGS